MFVVLSFVLVVVLIVGNYLDLGGLQYKGTMVACIMLSIAFLIFDTQLIIDGRYIDITVDDYVFMSMKLFADFILIFSLILKLLQLGNYSRFTIKNWLLRYDANKYS